MYTDCKHENITLDDLQGWNIYGEPTGAFSCPDCGKWIDGLDLQEMGYKLVKFEGINI